MQLSQETGISFYILPRLSSLLADLYNYDLARRAAERASLQSKYISTRDEVNQIPKDAWLKTGHPLLYNRFADPKNENEWAEYAHNLDISITKTNHNFLMNSYLMPSRVKMQIVCEEFLNAETKSKELPSPNFGTNGTIVFKSEADLKEAKANITELPDRDGVKLCNDQFNLGL